MKLHISKFLRTWQTLICRAMYSEKCSKKCFEKCLRELFYLADAFDLLAVTENRSCASLLLVFFSMQIRTRKLSLYPIYQISEPV